MQSSGVEDHPDGDSIGAKFGVSGQTALSGFRFRLEGPESVLVCPSKVCVHHVQGVPRICIRGKQNVDLPTSESQQLVRVSFPVEDRVVPGRNRPLLCRSIPPETLPMPDDRPQDLSVVGRRQGRA